MSEARPCSSKCLAAQGWQGTMKIGKAITSCTKLPVCGIDCSWNVWTEWSGCSRNCGGGHQTRIRGIWHPGSKGGKACEKETEEELRKCNTVSCDDACVDGQWAEWEPWAPCSATCTPKCVGRYCGGWSWQQRKVAVAANQCGKPVAGLSQQTKKCNEQVSCNEDIDCKFADWLPWGACSATCQGVKERSRFIFTEASGKGKNCKGATKQAAPCKSLAACFTAPIVCKLMEWTPFTACSHSCGGGVRQRSRGILSHGNCEGALAETYGCNTHLCHDPVDCLWSAWADWGACDVCGGERHRSRNVTRSGRYGGKACKQNDAAEVGNCTRSCHGKSLCAWAGWSAWSSCSKSCGASGDRTRTRVLHLVNSSDMFMSKLYADDDGLEDKVNELYRKNQHAETQRAQHIAIAFLSGCLSLVVAFVFLSAPRSRPPAMSRQISLTTDPWTVSDGLSWPGLGPAVTTHPGLCGVHASGSKATSYASLTPGAV